MNEEHDPRFERRARNADYRVARIAVAIALTFVLGLLLLFDASDQLFPNYELQPTTLGVLVTMILVLLGLEATVFRSGGK